jgi:hypothetical protein
MHMLLRDNGEHEVAEAQRQIKRKWPEVSGLQEVFTTQTEEGTANTRDTLKKLAPAQDAW